MFRAPNLGYKPTVCAASTQTHFYVTSMQLGGSGTNMKHMLTTVTWVRKSFVSGWGACYFSASRKLWQAHLLACKQGKISDPLQFLTPTPTVIPNSLSWYPAKRELSGSVGTCCTLLGKNLDRIHPKPFVYFIIILNYFFFQQAFSKLLLYAKHCYTVIENEYDFRPLEFTAWWREQTSKQKTNPRSLLLQPRWEVRGSFREGSVCVESRMNWHSLEPKIGVGWREQVCAKSNIHKKVNFREWWEDDCV